MHRRAKDYFSHSLSFLYSILSIKYALLNLIRVYMYSIITINILLLNFSLLLPFKVTKNNMYMYMYRISLKSRHGEI